jgi:hypothetical protein
MSTDPILPPTISTIASSYIFQPFSYEHRIVIPRDNSEYLLDVELSLHGIPAPMDGYSPHNVRMYLNSVDVTEQLKDQLKKLLDLANVNGVAHKAYEDALRLWGILMSKAGGEAAGDPAKLLSVKPMSLLLDQLGDRSVYHIFCSLYDPIAMQPVSLNTIIESNPECAKQGVALDMQGPLYITFSSGPCRLFDSNWDPRDIPERNIWGVPRGGISYSLTFNYRNPLDEHLITIEELIRNLILLVDPGSELRGTLNDALTGIDEILTRAGFTRKESGDHNLIAAMQESLTEIRGKLKI